MGTPWHAGYFSLKALSTALQLASGAADDLVLREMSPG